MVFQPAAGDGTRRRALELAATDPVESIPWRQHPQYPDVQVKKIPLGGEDWAGIIAAKRTQLDPTTEHIRRINRLDHPYDVSFSRHEGPQDVEGTDEITGKGKAGSILSHVSQAMQELLAKRPMDVTFAAEHPSRNRVYRHIMRRAIEQGAGGGQYVFLKGRYSTPELSAYAIVHRDVAHLPQYRKGWVQLGQPSEEIPKAAIANSGEALHLAGSEPVQPEPWAIHNIEGEVIKRKSLHMSPLPPEPLPPGMRPTAEPIESIPSHISQGI